MKKFKHLRQILIVFSLIFVNFIPILGPSSFGEIGAPAPNVTTVTWIIEPADDVSYNNIELWTRDIQVNSTGRMTWDKVSAYINGNITVHPDAFFNLSNCFLNLSGDLLINGTVNFDNVTLIMNSTYDGECVLRVLRKGNFNVLNNSNITAYDTTTPIDIYKVTPGNESYGYHYNFTVRGNITINNSYVSYTFGDSSYWGGIHLYETARAVITNSTIYEHEMSAIYAERNEFNSYTHVIQNNHIYNVTRIGIALLNHADATIDNNIIETYTDNYGFGIACGYWSHPLIIRNTIKNNRYDGVYLVYYSNATIQDNDIIDNQRNGINITSTAIVDLFGNLIDYSFCYPEIINNTIDNNKEFGIWDLASPAEITNNTISNTVNQSGVWVQGYLIYNNWVVFYQTYGNITDNTIQYNNHYGINLSHNFYPAPNIISMTVKNNTITNNNWSGIFVMGGRYQNNQYSPKPTIISNNLSYNNHSGLKTHDTTNFQANGNYIVWNNQSGVHCVVNSRPEIDDNDVYWNKKHGIETVGARPNIHDNRISNNSYSGVYVQGGSNVVTVKSNDITYNTWVGVECNSTDGLIRSNNINNNSQDGIRITGGNPTISQDNLVNYNNWNGLAAYDSRPRITDSDFRYNSKNGIYLDHSTARTLASSDNNVVTNNAMHGIMCINSTHGGIKADISDNTLDGVYTADAGTNIKIINSNIFNNNRNGVNATTQSNPVIANSSIQTNSLESFWIEGSSDPIALNTTFPESEVYFKDTASTFTRSWYLNIRTKSKPAGTHLSYVDVWVNSSIQSTVIWHGLSDINGRINGLEITEYLETDNNGDHRAALASEHTDWTPHDISGDAWDHRNTHVTPMPTINRSQTIILELEKNNAPNKVSNIKPLITHNPHPTIKWSIPSPPDPDDHIVGYQLWIGTTQNTSDAFAHNSPLISTNQLTLNNDLEYDNDGNKSYYVTIISNDHHGGENYAFHNMYLINSKPTKPEIALIPHGLPSVNLPGATCLITTPSTDPDGDQINYTYKWFKNGKEVLDLREANTGETEDSISITTDDIQFEKEDIWEVRVYANDGLGAGTSSMSLTANASFYITNLGPQIANKISSITMDEDTELVDEIDLTQAFTDPDQSATSLKFKITVSDENLTITKDDKTHLVSIKPESNWNGWAIVNFTCLDSEGLWVTQFVNVTVKPINDEPEFVEIGGKDITSGIINFVSDDAAFEESWFNRTILISDIDIERNEDDEISYKVSNESVKITKWENDPLRAMLSFYPTNANVGYFEFTLAIKDEAMTSYGKTLVIKIEVKNVNDKPSFVSVKEHATGKVHPIPSSKQLDLTKIVIKEKETLILIVTATDPDLDDELTFNTDSTKYVEIDSDTGNPFTAKIIISPDEESIGEFNFNISVKDRKQERDTVQITLDVRNVNNKPTVRIVSPIEYDQIQIFEPNTIIIFEGHAEDSDIPYGDKLTYKWTSDMDGDLGYNLSISRDDLSIGEHEITFTAEDSYGEKSSTKIHIIIGGLDKDADLLPDDWETIYFGRPQRFIGDDDADGDGYTNLEEYLGKSDPTDKNDPEEQPKEEEIDMFLIGVGVGVVVVIIIVLLILFLILRKRKKEKGGAEPSKEEDIERPPITGTGVTPEGTAPAAPTTELPEQQVQAMGETATTEPGTGAEVSQPPMFTPPQLTTCPKCSTVMTFSPDGGMFCIRCGFKQEK